MIFHLVHLNTILSKLKVMQEVMTAAVAKKVLACDQELEGASLLTNKRRCLILE